MNVFELFDPENHLKYKKASAQAIILFTDQFSMDACYH